MADPVDVLDFWLGEIGEEGWYSGEAEIDTACRDGFLELWQAARDCGLDHWVDGTVGSLAYLILTDQLPRNIHRGHADAFATDGMARAAARKAVAADWDLGAPEPERQFFYLPFVHSEDLADQDFGVALMQERLPETGEDNVLHARAHREIIARYGRFPFRNKALGRDTTPEEQIFLDAGGYPALVKTLRGEAMQ